MKQDNKKTPVSIVLLGVSNLSYMTASDDSTSPASFKNLEAAVKKICFDINKENDRKICILFSPAAASFDQFKNFEDRGKYFNKLIKKIKLKI